MTAQAKNGRMNLRVRLAELLRPIMHRLPRGYGLIYKALGGSDDRNWSNEENFGRVFFDPTLHAYVFADIRQWSGRSHYYLGRYYDPAHQLLIHQLLGAGDTYVDIGANIGIHTLCASRRIGRLGRVMAFEPNRHCFEILKAHLVLNHVENCTPFEMALSDNNGELALSAPDEGPAMLNWSLRRVEGAKTSLVVPVRVGDEVLKSIDVRGRLLIKIDTEGFEHQVVRGLCSLLAYPETLLSIEITDRWLKQCGSSATALFEELRGHGFSPYLPHLRTTLWGRAELSLEALDGPLDQRQYDVLFSRTDPRAPRPEQKT